MQFFTQINLTDGLLQVVLNAVRHYLFLEIPHVSLISKIKTGVYSRAPKSHEINLLRLEKTFMIKSNHNLTRFILLYYGL